MGGRSGISAGCCTGVWIDDCCFRYHGIEASAGGAVEWALSTVVSGAAFSRSSAGTSLVVVRCTLSLGKANSESSVKESFCNLLDVLVLKAHGESLKGEARDTTRLEFGAVAEARAPALRQEVQINLEETALESDMARCNGGAAACVASCTWHFSMTWAFCKSLLAQSEDASSAATDCRLPKEAFKRRCHVSRRR